MEGYTRLEERKFEAAIRLYRRAAKKRMPGAAKLAAEMFLALRQFKWQEKALELCYELKGREA